MNRLVRKLYRVGSMATVAYVGYKMFDMLVETDNKNKDGEHDEVAVVIDEDKNTTIVDDVVRKIGKANTQTVEEQCGKIIYISVTAMFLAATCYSIKLACKPRRDVNNTYLFMLKEDNHE